MIFSNQVVLWIFTLSFLLISLGPNVSAALPLDPAEVEVLEEVLSFWPQMKTQYNWTGNASLACGPWKGLSCQNRGNFSHIGTLSLNFTTPRTQACWIPENIGNLTYLRVLTVVGNLSRPIPSTIQNLTSLVSIYIGGLSGGGTLAGDTPQAFPNWISQLTNLTSFTTVNVNFSGSSFEPVPGSLSKLTTFGIVNSGMGSTFPNIQNLTTLTTINFVGSYLISVIPPWINELTQLQTISLANNRLVSPFPDNVANLTSLWRLDISSNRYNGTFPRSILSLKNLTNLNLSYNKFTGEIPDLHNMTSLNNLNFLQNNMSGDISVVAAGLDLSFCNVSRNPALLCPTSFVVCCVPGGKNSTTTTSTTGGCSGFTCACSSNLGSLISPSSACVNGKWVIAGNVTSDSKVVVGQGDQVVIAGSFVQSDQGALQVFTNGGGSGPSIQVGETASLGGDLVISITSNLTGSITVINASAVNGEFKAVRISSQYDGSSCDKTQITPVYSSSSMSVLVETTKGKCKGNKGKTIGIAVGVSLGGVIIIVAILFVVIFLYRKHRGDRAITMVTSTPPQQRLI